MDMEEGEDDIQHNIPHTDLPDVILVEEDEHTEKIDNEVPSVNPNSSDQVQSAEKDNLINEEMLKRQPEPMATNPGTKTTEAKADSPRLANQEYSQPQVEVINAGDEMRAASQESNQEALFLKAAASTDDEERPRARVAFADPTLRSNPSTPVRPAAATPVSAAKTEPGPSEEEMTLASLGPEELAPEAAPTPDIETKETKKVTDPPKEALIKSPEPKAQELETEKRLPTLGNYQYRLVL